MSKFATRPFLTQRNDETKTQVGNKEEGPKMELGEKEGVGVVESKKTSKIGQEICGQLAIERQNTSQVCKEICHYC